MNTCSLNNFKYRIFNMLYHEMMHHMHKQPNNILRAVHSCFTQVQQPNTQPNALGCFQLPHLMIRTVKID